MIVEKYKKKKKKKAKISNLIKVKAQHNNEH
jgi:hypothetical protein